MHKPVIGVTPDFNPGTRKDMGGKEPTYFLRARYLQAIEETGGVPIVLPLLKGRRHHQQLLERIDGLLVTGSGWDLAPEHLKSGVTPMTGLCMREKGRRLLLTHQ